MNSVRVLGILIILLIIVILGQKYFLNPIEKKQKALISPTPTSPAGKSPTSAVFREEQNQPSNTPTPIINQNQNNEQSEDLIYPGSIKIKEDNGSLELESLDDAQKITDWYKEKIKGMGMNAKSFVQTKANEKILNKLVGSNGKKEIRVEISKENNRSTIKIYVVTINL